METRKIVINCDYGGFGLSEEAKLLYEKQSGEQKEDFFEFDLKRDDPILVRIVEELGDKASDSSACLKVVEIPADVKWGIHDYDGKEWVAEQHRTWRQLKTWKSQT